MLRGERKDSEMRSLLSNPGETQKNAMDTLTSQNDLPPHFVICCGKRWRLSFYYGNVDLKVWKKRAIYFLIISEPWLSLSVLDLADLNEQAQERLDTIMEQMKAAEGVTEDLKRTRQMEWVQRCNNIHNRAEEIVLHEMIYA